MTQQVQLIMKFVINFRAILLDQIHCIHNKTEKKKVARILTKPICSSLRLETEIPYNTGHSDLIFEFKSGCAGNTDLKLWRKTRTRILLLKQNAFFVCNYEISLVETVNKNSVFFFIMRKLLLWMFNINEYSR